MSKIVDYDLMGSVDDIKQALIDGWQPHGAPFVDGGWCQAMVKYAEDAPVTLPDLSLGDGWQTIRVVG